MIRTLLSLLHRPALGSLAFLVGVSLVQAQGNLPAIPQSPMQITTAGAQLPPTGIAPPAGFAVPTAKPGLGEPRVQDAAPRGQTPTTNAAPADPELKARIERLEQQNLELINALRGLKAGSLPTAAPLEPGQGSLDKADVQKIVGDYLKGQEDKKKADEAAKAAAGHKVGTDLKMNVRWETPGLKFETAHKDFSIHLGARFMYDSVWFNQSANLKPTSQVGDLQDGSFFRRTRISADGTFWEVGEFNMEVALENVTNGIVALDDFYMGVNKVPFLGTIRAGHHKIPQGFESGNVSSSRSFTFVERSAYGEAFYPDFGTGLWIGNNVLHERATWSMMGYRQQRSGHGVDFADGELGFSGRLTALPIYENQGRHYMHVGFSGTVRGARRPGNGLSGETGVSASGRPEVRDFAGGDNGFGTGANPGNRAAWVSTGTILADTASLYGAEFLYVRGPFSVQAEYGMSYFNDATAIIGGKKVAQGDLPFDGGYVAVAYFLTGEHRSYDKKQGRLTSYIFKGPHTPFWLVRGDDGRLNCGLGAWEVAARYSHLNLNSGAVKGGVLDGVSLALNWYLNSNLRVQFDYIHANRYRTNTGVVPGDVNALAIRTEFKF